MHYESDSVVPVPMVCICIHKQPFATINHNMFQIHVYIHWLLPKDRRYDLEDILWKERNNYA